MTDGLTNRRAVRRTYSKTVLLTLKVYRKYFFPTLVKNYEGDRQTDKMTYRVACMQLKT